ncbi:hypothetical protein [Curtobacterium sp. ISL-83]|uniref:hypothetical protein n=1 Tax=Curtobacterium sp. ISL-83 TaxID=2819145 RepID=UPI001BE6381F|nr:hypothetical protein [Curtobacterium sp. ISL-83]MBT2501562.1 hypothetical protein [Curtobacterium sp. ISL-83]
MWRRSEPEDFDEFGVLSFDECFGGFERVVIDTSFVRRAFDSGADGHPEAAAFLQHLDLTDSDVFFNALLELDLLDIDRRSDGVAGVSGLDGPRTPRVGSFLTAWNSVLRTTSAHWVGIDALLDDVPGLVESFGITSSAALVVATAGAVEADALVTADPTFAVVDKELLRLCVGAPEAPIVRRVRARGDGGRSPSALP